MGKVTDLLSKPLITVIRMYQYVLSPLMRHGCRFYPSCSSYAIEAIQQRGCLCGCYLTLKRILRCHPFAKGGLDPVPEPKVKCRQI